MFKQWKQFLDYSKENSIRIVLATFLTSAIVYYLSCEKEYFENQGQIIHRRKRSSFPSEEERRLIVDRHNEHRASIGDEGEEPIPSNMRFLTWDDELAVKSMRHAKRCKWKHSDVSERMLERYRLPCGENMWAGNGKLRTNFDPIRATDAWFDEYKWYTFANRSCLPRKKCGHYTLVVWATVYKIGCAWTICDKLEEGGTVMKDGLFMVCLYAPGGNSMNTDSYLIGDRCSGCDANDTCPDGRLCRNEEREKLFILPSNDGAIAGALVGMVLLAATVGGVAYYWHVKQGSQPLFLLAWRKRRRVSSVDILDENDNGKPETKPSSEKNSPEPKPRGETTLASVKIAA